MKKISILAIALFAFALLAPSTQAQAFPEFQEFKTVDSLTLTDKDVFGFDETPSLYYLINPASSGSLMSFWLEGNNFAGYVGQASATGEGYLSLSNWDSIKTAGDWTIKGFYNLDQYDQNLCATTNFVVTPEPISMVLFGIGGLPLAAGLIRRKKIA